MQTFVRNKFVDRRLLPAAILFIAVFSLSINKSLFASRLASRKLSVKVGEVVKYDITYAMNHATWHRVQQLHVCHESCYVASCSTTSRMS